MEVWKIVGGVYLLAWFVQWIIFWTIKRNSTGYFHAHVVHFERIVWIQLLMILGSVYIWKRISNLLFLSTSARNKRDPDDEESGRADNTYRQVQTAERSRISNYTGYVRSAILILLGVYLFCAHFAWFLNYFANSAEPRWISWICLISLGIWLHSAVFLVVVGIVEFAAGSIYSRARAKAILQPILSRLPWSIQQLLTNSSWHTIIAIMLALLLSVMQLPEARKPRVEKMDLILDKLPARMDGFKIALLTDMHAGPSVGRNAFTRAVEMTNKLNPDIVTIVGDLVDGTTEDLKDAVEPLGHLKTKYGVYFATGNHEMYFGKVDDWIAYLQTLNVRTLRNNHVKIGMTMNGKEPSGLGDGQYLCLAGADDITAAGTGVEGHAMNLSAAVDGCSENSLVVLMAHNPRAAKLALDLERKVDLILCGHTHAGQMYIMTPVMYARMPYFHGLYEYSQTGTYIYVSAGVFYFGTPMKMLGMSEIILITLKSPALS